MFRTYELQEFFTGLHVPAHAKYFDCACISINRLRRRRKPIVNDKGVYVRVLVDSGAFTELNLYGAYRHSVEEYAVELHRLYTSRTVFIVGAVAQDYMCEEFMLKKTGLSVVDHQRLTIERYDALVKELNRLFEGNVPFAVLPVLQGYQPYEYISHISQYGERLKPNMWVGVGSVCKRNANPKAIFNVLAAIKSIKADLHLHGFGVKSTALKSVDVANLLSTSDSMAWSFNARQIYGPAANDWREAKIFEQQIRGICGLSQDATVPDHAY